MHLFVSFLEPLERNQLSPYLYTTIGLNNAAFGIALERPGGSNLRAFFVPVTRHYRLRWNDGNGIYSNLTSRKRSSVKRPYSVVVVSSVVSVAASSSIGGVSVSALIASTIRSHT